MLFRLCQHFSRSTKEIIRASRMREIRQAMLEWKAQKYKSPVMFMHKDNVRVEYFYGKNNYLSAVTRNTFESSEFTNQTLKSTDPDEQLLILGGLDNNELDTYMGQDLRIIDDSSQMFCRQDLTFFAQKIEPYSKKMIYYDNKRTLFILNDESKSIHTHDYLTAGINALEMETCQVMYGQPSSILVVEDLILRYSLQQLEQMFYQLVNHLKRTYRCEILTHSHFIKIWLHDMAQELFRNSLYGKLNSFMAALFKKACRNNKKCLMLLSRHFIDIVAHDSIRDPGQPDNLYRGYLKQTDHPEKQLYQRAMKEFTVEEVLKKFAILSVMMNPQLTEYVWQEKQFFRHTIFRHLFQDMTLEEIKNVFVSTSDKYRDELYGIQNQFIENNLYIRTPQLPLRLLLSQQGSQKQLQQQKYPLRFDVNNHEFSKQQQQTRELAENIMLDTLDKQKRRREKELLEEFLSGQYSKQNIVLYSKLLGQTIIKHELPLRLPVHHFSAFRGYYKNVMKRKILNDKYKHNEKEAMYLGEKEDIEMSKVMQEVNSENFNPSDFIEKLESKGVHILEGEAPEGMTRIRREATDEEMKKIVALSEKKFGKRGSKTQ